MADRHRPASISMAIGGARRAMAIARPRADEREPTTSRQAGHVADRHRTTGDTVRFRVC
jgi:hypothetical protein